jgi:hypothetical protein
MFMGPPELQPDFPRYHQLFATDGVRVTGNGGYVERANVFLAMHDNNMDPWHGEIAHGWYRGRPPTMTMHHGRDGEPATPIKYDRTPWGTRMVVVKNTKKPGAYWYHETHTVWPTQRLHQENAKAIKWAVPMDDHRTRWFTVDFFPYDENGQPTKECVAFQNSRFHIGHMENMPNDWAQQVGHWWNLGHPWRQNVPWEDEVCQATQGPAERHGLPNWDRWRLATSDRGLMLNHEVWVEQVERVKQGLDPIGVTRGVDPGALIRVPGDNIHNLTWDEAMRLYEMSVEERVAMLGREPDWLLAKPKGRGLE